MKTFILIGLFFPCFLTAQNYLDFEQIFTVTSSSSYAPLALTVHLPKTIPGRQKLEHIEFSIPPEGIVDEAGAYYAYYNNDLLVEHKEVNVKSSLILYRNDWNTAKKRGKPLEIEEDLTPYLSAQAHIQINAKPILHTAIGLKGSDEEVSVRNIFNFVVNHLEYRIFKNQNRDALTAYKERKGDCTEYSELMIALCRAIGIPARYVNGFVAKSGKNVRHNWVEVYFSEYGWVAFDPTFADSRYGKTSFDRMKNIYIYVGFERDDPISGWRYPLNNTATLTQGCKATSYLDKAIEKINRKVRQNKKEQAKRLIDSLIDYDVPDYRLFNYQAKFHLEEDQLDLALISLQSALKHCYFPKDKGESFFYFAVYHSKRANVDLAFSYLQKALEIEYHLKRKEIKDLMEDDTFAALRALDAFDELTASIQKRYKEQKKSESESGFILYNDLHLLNPRCQGVADNAMPFDLEALTKDLMLKNKVRKIIVDDEWSAVEYHFSKTGKELSRSSITGKERFYSQIDYDEEDRKIGLSYLMIDEDQDSSYVKWFYLYEGNCLVEVKQCDFDCSTETAKTVLLINRSAPDTTRVLSFDFLSNEERRKEYLFDQQNRILCIDIYDDQDTLKIDWLYKDEENTQIKYVDQEESEVWKKTADGRLLERIRKDFSTFNTYSRKNQLIKKIRKSTHQRGTSTTEYQYQYYNNGLVKSRRIKNNHTNKLMYPRSYQYEFYD